MTPIERLAMSLDPVQLARRCEIEPDAWQAQLLRSEARQVILNCTHQAGNPQRRHCLRFGQRFSNPA